MPVDGLAAIDRLRRLEDAAQPRRSRRSPRSKSYHDATVNLFQLVTDRNFGKLAASVSLLRSLPSTERPPRTLLKHAANLVASAPAPRHRHGHGRGRSAKQSKFRPQGDSAF